MAGRVESVRGGGAKRGCGEAELARQGRAAGAGSPPPSPPPPTPPSPATGNVASAAPSLKPISQNAETFARFFEPP